MFVNRILSGSCVAELPSFVVDVVEFKGIVHSKIKMKSSVLALIPVLNSLFSETEC